VRWLLTGTIEGKVETAGEMLNTTKKDIGWADVFVSAAAESDFSGGTAHDFLYRFPLAVISA